MVTSYFDELVVLLKEDPQEQSLLQKSGYYVIVKKPDEIKDPATATLKPPFFLVTSPRGQGVYAGAYGTQPGQDTALRLRR